MGLDLTLIVNRFGDKFTDMFVATDRLSLYRDYSLFAQLSPDIEAEEGDCVCDPLPVPKDWSVEWHDDDGLRRITTDAYGSPLTYLTARDFEPVEFGAKAYPWNVAVVDFVKSLPGETQVVLYWH